MPAGTFLGDWLGWRVAFLSMTVLTVVLLVWIFVGVPDFPGQERGERPKLLRTLTIPGVSPVLFVTLVFVLAHTILYAYIASYLKDLGLDGHTGLILLVFGAASLASIWIVGAQINRLLRGSPSAAPCSSPSPRCSWPSSPTPPPSSMWPPCCGGSAGRCAHPPPDGRR